MALQQAELKSKIESDKDKKDIKEHIESGILKPEFLNGHKAQVNSVVVSTDGQYALSGSHDNTLRLWTLSIGKCTGLFKGHTDIIWSVAFSPNNTQALSGSSDGTLRLWTLSTGHCARVFKGHSLGVYSVAINGQQALSGSCDRTMRLWSLSNINSCREFHHPCIVNSVALSIDGKYALSGGGDSILRLWSDMYTASPPVKTFQGHTAAVNSVALSSDGKYVLSGSDDRTVRLCSINENVVPRARVFLGHTAPVNCVTISADDKYVLSGSDDKTVRLWSLTGELLRTISFEHPVLSVKSHVEYGELYALVGLKSFPLQFKHIFSIHQSKQLVPIVAAMPLKATPNLARQSSELQSKIESDNKDKKDHKEANETVTAQDIQTFLSHIAWGREKEVKAMLDVNKNLALASGDVTDPAGRTFRHITGFQYAVWALDWKMWTMLLQPQYLPIEGAIEQAKGFTEGSWLEKHSEHATWKNLTDVLQVLIEDWVALSYEQCDKYWVKIQDAQFKLPIHVLQEYCNPYRPFEPCPRFTDQYTLERNLPVWLNTGILAAKFDFGISRNNDKFSTPNYRAPRGWFSPPWMLNADRVALVSLYDTRLQQRNQMVVTLIEKAYKAIKLIQPRKTPLQRYVKMVLTSFLKEINKHNPPDFKAVKEVIEIILTKNEDQIQEAVQILKSSNLNIPATKNNVVSMWLLGFCYEHGLGVIKSDWGALNYYMEADDLGYEYAQFGLAAINQRNEVDDKDRCESCKLLLTNGSVPIIFGILVFFDSLSNLVINTKMLDFLLTLSDQGNADASLLLALCGIDMDIDNPNVVKTVTKKSGIEFLVLAAEQGHMEAQFLLAIGCVSGTWIPGFIVPKNMKKTLELLELSANQGHFEAQSTLAFYYEKEMQDYQNAVKWHALAANQGVVKSQMAIADCYIKGRGIEKNIQMANAWYVHALENSTYTYKLGFFYKQGLGVPQNAKKAFELFESAGVYHKQAQYQLGLCYLRGIGVDKNQAKAHECFQRSEAINSEEEYLVGLCYEEGFEIKQDRELAMLWYRRAVNQGFEKAKVGLKRLLLTCFYDSVKSDEKDKALGHLKDLESYSSEPLLLAVVIPEEPNKGQEEPLIFTLAKFKRLEWLANGFSLENLRKVVDLAGNTSLHLAARDNRLEFFRPLIERDVVKKGQGPHNWPKNKQGFSPFFIAIQTQLVNPLKLIKEFEAFSAEQAAVKDLEKAKVDNIKLATSLAALMKEAIDLGLSEIVLTLIREFGVDPTEKEMPGGISAAWYACQKDQTEITEKIEREIISKRMQSPEGGYPNDRLDREASLRYPDKSQPEHKISAEVNWKALEDKSDKETQEAVQFAKRRVLSCQRVDHDTKQTEEFKDAAIVKADNTLRKIPDNDPRKAEIEKAQKAMIETHVAELGKPTSEEMERFFFPPSLSNTQNMHTNFVSARDRKDEKESQEFSLIPDTTFELIPILQTFEMKFGNSQTLKSICGFIESLQKIRNDQQISCQSFEQVLDNLLGLNVFPNEFSTYVKFAKLLSGGDDKKSNEEFQKLIVEYKGLEKFRFALTLKQLVVKCYAGSLEKNDIHNASDCIRGFLNVPIEEASLLNSLLCFLSGTEEKAVDILFQYLKTALPENYNIVGGILSFSLYMLLSRFLVTSSLTGGQIFTAYLRRVESNSTKHLVSFEKFRVNIERGLKKINSGIKQGGDLRELVLKGIRDLAEQYGINAEKEGKKLDELLVSHITDKRFMSIPVKFSQLSKLFALYVEKIDPKYIGFANEIRVYGELVSGFLRLSACDSNFGKLKIVIEKVEEISKIHGFQLNEKLMTSIQAMMLTYGLIVKAEKDDNQALQNLLNGITIDSKNHTNICISIVCVAFSRVLHQQIGKSSHANNPPKGWTEIIQSFISELERFDLSKLPILKVLTELKPLIPTLIIFGGDKQDTEKSAMEIIKTYNELKKYISDEYQNILSLFGSLMLFQCCRVDIGKSQKFANPLLQLVTRLSLLFGNPSVTAGSVLAHQLYNTYCLAEKKSGYEKNITLIITALGNTETILKNISKNNNMASLAETDIFKLVICVNVGGTVITVASNFIGYIKQFIGATKQASFICERVKNIPGIDSSLVTQAQSILNLVKGGAGPEALKQLQSLASSKLGVVLTGLSSPLALGVGCAVAVGAIFYGLVKQSQNQQENREDHAKTRLILKECCEKISQQINQSQKELIKHVDKQLDKTAKLVIAELEENIKDVLENLKEIRDDILRSIDSNFEKLHMRLTDKEARDEINRLNKGVKEITQDFEKMSVQIFIDPSMEFKDYQEYSLTLFGILLGSIDMGRQQRRLSELNGFGIHENINIKNTILNITDLKLRKQLLNLTGLLFENEELPHFSGWIKTCFWYISLNHKHLLLSDEEINLEYIKIQRGRLPHIIHETKAVLTFFRSKQAKERVKSVMNDICYPDEKAHKEKESVSENKLSLLRLIAEVLGFPIVQLGEPKNITLFAKNSQGIQKKFERCISKIIIEELEKGNNTSKMIVQFEDLIWSLEMLKRRLENRSNILENKKPVRLLPAASPTLDLLPGNNEAPVPLLPAFHIHQLRQAEALVDPLRSAPVQGQHSFHQ